MWAKASAAQLSIRSKPWRPHAATITNAFTPTILNFGAADRDRVERKASIKLTTRFVPKPLKALQRIRKKGISKIHVAFAIFYFFKKEKVFLEKRPA